MVFCVTFGHVLAACTAKGRSVPLFARPEFGFGSPSELLKWIADPADRRLKNLVLDRHHMGAEQHQQQSVPKRSGGAWPLSSRVKSCTMSIAPLFPRLLVCLFVRLLTARDERLLGSKSPWRGSLCAPFHGVQSLTRAEPCLYLQHRDGWWSIATCVVRPCGY